MYSRRRLLFTAAALVAAAKAAGQERDPSVRRIAVTARKYTFEPARIEVAQDELVRVELRSLDIPHSMTIDGYRISKRVNPGAPVTFEFRADREGTFPFYCNLQIDEGCRQMRGDLIVRPRR